VRGAISNGRPYRDRQPTRQVGTKAENALLALIPHVQEVRIAGGDNIAVAFVNGAV
jgi:hypothetical protein